MFNLFKKHINFFILLILVGSFLFYLINYSFYRNEDNLLYTFLWTLNSDWMMHLSQVQSFAFNPFLEVIYNNPIYSGEILAYPFFINWISGILLYLTNNLVFAMTLPMYIGTIIFLFGIYFLTYQITKNTYISLITPLIFIFLSGFQVLYTLFEYSWDQFKNIHNYTFDNQFLFNNGFNWKSFLLTTYLPQRSFLLGMGIGTIALGLFFQYIQNKFTTFFIPFCIGLLIGCLSFIHTHSFLLFFFLFLGLTIIYNKEIKKIFLIGLGAFLSSSPFLYFLQEKNSVISDFSLWPLNRMGYDFFFSYIDFLNINLQNFLHIFYYWMQNLGLGFLLPILLLSPYITKKISFNPDNYKFLYNLNLIGFILIIIFSIIQLQNNPWDNTKVHLWSVLFFSIGISNYIVYLWKTKIYIPSILLFILSIISGIIMLYSGIKDNDIKIFSKSEENKAKIIKAKIESSSIILTSDYFHHFLSPLTPNPIFMGYRGWIGSYGLDINNRINNIKEIYSGSKNALKIIKENNIKYVYIDNSAITEFKININIDFFKKYFKPIFKFQENEILYRIN
jgi:hypothetical protein